LIRNERYCGTRHIGSRNLSASTGKTRAIETNRSLENEQSQQEINQLHDENNRLKTELLQTQSRMEGIQRFLNGGNGGAIEKTTQEKMAAAAIAMTTPADSIKTQSAAITALPTSQKVSDAVSS
jgi:hypothetical protein